MMSGKNGNQCIKHSQFYSVYHTHGSINKMETQRQKILDIRLHVSVCHTLPHHYVSVHASLIQPTTNNLMGSSSRLSNGYIEVLDNNIRFFIHVHLWVDMHLRKM